MYTEPVSSHMYTEPGPDYLPGNPVLRLADRVGCHVFLLTRGRHENEWVVGYGQAHLNPMKRRRAIEVLHERQIMGSVRFIASCGCVWVATL